MSEHEKNLRTLEDRVRRGLSIAVHGAALAVSGKMDQEARRAEAAFDVLLSEHRAALARARAEALDEAADMADAACNEAKRRKKDCDTTTPMGRTMHRTNEAQEDVLGPLADDIRALITTPAPATIPVEAARAALEGAAYVKTRNALGARDDETLQDAAARVVRESVPVEKVREVLKWLRDHPTSFDMITSIEAADRLGVDLDREGA